MLVAHASSGRKIPCRERHRIYVHDHLGASFWFPFIVILATAIFLAVLERRSRADREGVILSRQIPQLEKMPSRKN